MAADQLHRKLFEYARAGTSDIYEPNPIGKTKSARKGKSSLPLPNPLVKTSYVQLSLFSRS